MTIAGSDSGGGAGIQADLKTFAAHRVHGLSALSALTAQSTTEVRAVHPVSTEFVAAQVDTLADDFTIHAVKTGMIGEPETIELIVDRVARWSWPLVVDPVMVAASGDRLASDAVVEAFRRLIPRATVVTPNLDEVEVLLGWRPVDADGMARAGRALLQLGAQAVLVKGGHLDGDPVDVWVDGDGTQERSGARLCGTTHGSGCTYASALAARIARGESPSEAFAAAHAYVRAAIACAPDGIGRGQGPMHHFHPFFDRWASGTSG
jgi:hydroxymethylpyrimidine/phosphomethylpyrimidine kinase